jgi:hypothetical protein
MKIRPVGSAFLHEKGGTDGQTEAQTDMTKLVAAFGNFVKEPKNLIFSLHVYEKLNLKTFIDGFVQNIFN